MRKNQCKFEYWDLIKGYRFYIKVTCMKSEVANLLSLNPLILTKRISFCKINRVIHPLFF